MKKTVAAAAALFLCLSLCGCARQYTDFDAANEAGATLGERIFIDGVDVSGFLPNRRLVPWKPPTLNL